MLKYVTITIVNSDAIKCVVIEISRQLFLWVVLLASSSRSARCLIRRPRTLILSSVGVRFFRRVVTKTRSFLNRALPIYTRRMETKIKGKTNSPNMLSFFVRYALLILIFPFLFFSFFSNEGLELRDFHMIFIQDGWRRDGNRPLVYF